MNKKDNVRNKNIISYQSKRKCKECIILVYQEHKRLQIKILNAIVAVVE